MTEIISIIITTISLSIYIAVFINMRNNEEKQINRQIFRIWELKTSRDFKIRHGYAKDYKNINKE